MARYGSMFGPDVTFLGVDRCDIADSSTFDDADVVIVGAPFDGGTSYRSGARFGPSAMRAACYLEHDGSRPSLAMRVDGLRDLRVVDAGDVEMFSGDAAASCRALEQSIERVAAAGAKNPALVDRLGRTTLVLFNVLVGIARLPASQAAHEGLLARTENQGIGRLVGIARQQGKRQADQPQGCPAHSHCQADRTGHKKVAYHGAGTGVFIESPLVRHHDRALGEQGLRQHKATDKKGGSNAAGA